MSNGVVSGYCKPLSLNQILINKWKHELQTFYDRFEQLQTFSRTD